MDLPSDTPRLPKWIFLTGDAFLLLAAWYIADQSARPMTGSTLVAIAICVAVAVVLGAFPFVADYARRQDEALDNRQRALQALAATVTSASEQVSIAASGLDRLAGIAQENFTQSDRVAQQIKEKMAELHTVLAAAKEHDDDSAARLEAVAKKIAKAATDFEAAVSRAQEPVRAAPPPAPIPLEVPPVPASQIVEIRPAVVSSISPFVSPPPPVSAPKPAPAAPAPAPAPKPAPAPAPKPAPAPAPKPAPAVPAPVAKSAPAPAPAQAPAPAAPAAPAPAPEAAPPKRPPRKPAASAEPDLALDTGPSRAAPENAESAISADGATRLVITAYIGIGNRLFIRGAGPGLTWEKGVPLTFVSIGKWRWETDDATAPVKFKLYKNDEIECTALGERSVQPGAQQHLTADF